MAGEKGKSGPPGNMNAVKHGFYSAALMPGEEKTFEDAKTLSVDHEIALLRIMVLRAAKYEAEGGELAEQTQQVVNARLGRLRDFMMCRSIMQRNERESGASAEDDDWMERFKSTGAHRTTFKSNGKGNGKSGNCNGTG